MRCFLLIVLSICLWSGALYAQCAMPSGSPAAAGVIVFNDDHKVMQYCNGEKWIGLWGESSSGGGGGGLPACANGEIAQFSGGAWTCNNGSGIGNLNASNLTSGTVPRARLGSGTANSTTFLRGDGTWASPPSGGGSNDYQVFTANGTWTKPSGGSVTFVQCWGGGSGGIRYKSRSGFGTITSSSGGMGGGYMEAMLPTNQLPATVPVVVGAGGAAGVDTASPGGLSRFGTYVYAYGETGGVSGGPGDENGMWNNYEGSFRFAFPLWLGGASGIRVTPDATYYGGGGGCGACGSTGGLGCGGVGTCTAGGASKFGGNGGSPDTPAQIPGGGGAGGKAGDIDGRPGARGECRVLTW